MVIAWSFSEKDYICNEPRIQSTHSRVHFPWILVRGILNQRLYIPSLCCIRRWTKVKYKTRRAQVNFQHFQVSYTRTVLVIVFSCSRTVGVTVFTNCAFSPFFFTFFWSLFRSRSYPVPHRGERVKQGTVHPRNIVVITYKTCLSC
jgi:hypothetical protein